MALRFRKEFAALIGAGSLALLTGCGPASEVDARLPHIVLISVDSLRADHLSCYGYGRSTSPTLDRLATEGVLFEDVSSSSSWTLPAHAALFTGLPDSVHGADRGAHKLESWHRTLAEALKGHGYRTAGIWSGPLLDPRFGFDQGFDSYLGLDAGDRREAAWDARVQRSHEVVTGPEVLRRLDQILELQSEEANPADTPLFLFIHLWDVHYDYIPPPPFDSLFADPDYAGSVDGRGLTDLVLGKSSPLTGADLAHLKALYDGEIAFVDQQISDILERLNRTLSGDLITVVTADHGEEFFEHGHFGHKRTLFEESVRIPWILHAPHLLPADLRLVAPARIVDIAPTLLDLVAADPLPDTFGRSLLPLIRGKPMPSRPVISELVRGPQHLFAARSGSQKIIVSPGQRQVVGAFDLDVDPMEKNNRLAADGTAPDDAVRVWREASREIDRLKELHQGTRSIAGLDEDLRLELESLGYIGGGSAAGTDAENLDQVVFEATPNPIQVCDDSGLGVTKLVWWVPHGDPDVSIRLEQANGKLFAEGHAAGSAETGRWVTDGMRFVLVSKSDSRVLAETQIRVTASDCD